MKKRLLWFIAAVPLLAAAVYFTYQYVDRQPDIAITDSDIAKARQRLGQTAEPASVLPMRSFAPAYRVRLAIGNLGFKDQEHSREIEDLLAAKLSREKKMDLIERQSLDKVLNELNLNLGGFARSHKAVQVGKLLRADWFLLGTGASIGNSNILAIRIVDAQSGALVDAAVLADDRDPSRLADRLDEFVRGVRQANGASAARTYVAIGSFRDLSVNSRQAEFPTRLRGYLIGAYRGDPKITLLERECVETLLLEVRLDMAGWTDDTSTGPRQPMQSAFWLVDGYYQSYETTNLQVEGRLNVRRMFGRSTSVSFRGIPDEPFFKRIKQAVDNTFLANSTPLAPTRTTEARAQMEVGLELSGVKGGYLDTGLVRDDQEQLRRSRNMQEAVRAFETVLLLQPTNRSAKIYLAAIFCSGETGDFSQGLEYYREVIEEDVHDKWVLQSRQHLPFALRILAPDGRLRWYESALAQSTNKSAAEFFRQASENASRDVAIQSGQSSDVERLAQDRLLETIRRFDKGNWYGGNIGMDDFVDAFGSDRGRAVARLNDLLPKMKEVAPQSAPYLVATLVTFQTETNSPVIAELETLLDEYSERPKQISNKSATFVSHLRGAYDWSMRNKVYWLGVKIVEAKFRATGLDPTTSLNPSEDENKMALAFACKAAGQWSNALAVFQSWSNQPVYMGNGGPWGEAFSVVLTSKQTVECRKKLGLPSFSDPREFEMGEPVLCLCPHGAFTATPDGLWIAAGGCLLHLDFDLRTNLSVALPIDPATPITSLLLGPSRIWVATGGAGLLEYDKETKACSRLTERDGLMMDFISALELDGDTLWLGYGQQSSGGLGNLDLKTRRAKSFASSLIENTGNPNQPTRVPVLSIARGLDHDLWLVTLSSLSHYLPAEDSWQPSNHATARSVIVANDKLFVAEGMHPGINSSRKGGLGVSTLALKSRQWKSFPDVGRFPSGYAFAVCADGPNIWVGGLGYIALLDPLQEKVLKFAYIPASTVAQIQVAGGYLWAQFKYHLYRAPIAQ